jgi:hypothetical protein
MKIIKKLSQKEIKKVVYDLYDEIYMSDFYNSRCYSIIRFGEKHFGLFSQLTGGGSSIERVAYEIDQELYSKALEDFQEAYNPYNAYTQYESLKNSLHEHFFPSFD